MEYYKPKGVLTPMIGGAKELVSHKPINWIEYKIGKADHIIVKDISDEERMRLSR